MYAKLFEREEGVGGGGGGVQSVYGYIPKRGGAVHLQLYTKTGGGGGGGGGAVGKLMNQFVTHMHAAFSTKTQGTSRQTGPYLTRLTCPVVLHRFVDICPYN